jgi:hypothetical protein
MNAILTDDLLSQVGYTTDELRKAIAKAHTMACMAIRLVEARLVRELADGRLRGLPNLKPYEWPTDYAGARLRGIIDRPLDEAPIASSTTYGKESIVLTESGRLKVARCERHARAEKGTPALCTVSERDVTDHDLRAEDLEQYARVVAAAIARHVQRAHARTAELERLERLAAHMRKAVD